MSNVLELRPDRPRGRVAAALVTRLRGYQIDDLTYARPASLFHVVAGSHVVVVVEDVGSPGPARLYFSDLVVQRCACKPRERRVSAEQPEILPRGVPRGQVGGRRTGAVG